jgi:diacylglycerol kinase
MRVSYDTINALLWIAYFIYCTVYLILVLFFKLSMFVFFVVTIAVLSATLFLLAKSLDEIVDRIEEDIEELKKHSKDNPG